MANGKVENIEIPWQLEFASSRWKIKLSYITDQGLGFHFQPEARLLW